MMGTHWAVSWRRGDEQKGEQEDEQNEGDDAGEVCEGEEKERDDEDEEEATRNMAGIRSLEAQREMPRRQIRGEVLRRGRLLSPDTSSTRAITLFADLARTRYSSPRPPQGRRSRSPRLCTCTPAISCASTAFCLPAI